MTTLIKIFLAVVALFAYSCVTDVTEDLGVKVDGDQTTEITISLEESRTQLGEKAGNLYPLYWSEGDQISINGNASQPLGSNFDGSASATFTVNGTLLPPFGITYPAAPAGQVIFAENQTHVSNSTFGKGVSTMYAYSTDGTTGEVKHLTGVLKIGVTGSATLTYAQISTIDRAPIAGAFDLNFESGEASPTPYASSVINYNFPITADAEGLSLSNEPQYLHIAVPAGEYNELYVTLYDNQGGVMYAIIKADDEKPLAAGMLREFTNSIAYTPNADVFVIKDAASLLDFAAQAATLTKDVLFVADVDMSGQAWTPIEGYAGAIHGNGYAINGLTAPLFGITNASIKGLHLTNVNINETENPNVGALARQIVANDSVAPVIEHCSTSGNITVNCPNYAFKNESVYHEFSIGGITGSALGASLLNCENHVNINIKQIVSHSLALNIKPGIGGLVGALSYHQRTDKSRVLAAFANCTNYGNLSIENGTYQEGDTTGYIQNNIGGCLGIQFMNNYTTFENIVNHGNITVDATFLAQTANIAGVVAWCYSTTATNLHNHGAITWNSHDIYPARISGVIGMLAKDNTSGSYASHLYNHGDIKINKGIKINNKFLVSGCVAEHEDGVTLGQISNCENNGDITVEADMIDNNTAFRIAGIVSYSPIEATDLVNNGDITVSSRLYNAESAAYYLCIAGVSAYKATKGITNAKNTGDITFSGKVETKSDATASVKDACRLNLGGIMGFGNGVCGSGLYNEGEITIDNASFAGQLRMGGTVGQANAKVADAHNSGNIFVKGTTSIGSQLILGGIAGYARGANDSTNSGDITIESTVTVESEARVGGCMATLQNNPIDNFTNSGTISVQGTYKSVAYVGGVAGKAEKNISNSKNLGSITLNGTFANTVNLSGIVGASNQVISDCTNEGAITANGKYSAPVYLGGAVGFPENSVSDCTNKGAITLDANINAATSCGVGGLIGFNNDCDKTGVHTNLTNEGTITVKGSSTYTIYTGGILGNINMANKHTNLVNKESGVITVAMDEGSTGNAYIAGIGGLIQDSTYELYNYAAINVSGHYAAINLGGLIAADNVYTRSGHKNYGDITVSATATGGAWIGGICSGDEYGQDWINTANYGDITITKEASIAKSLFVGGIYGKLDVPGQAVNFVSCVNEGNITISGRSGFASGTFSLAIGGLAGSLRPSADGGTITITDGFINKGNITFDGNHEGAGSVMIGGITGVLGIREAATAWTGTLVNVGNITCTGTFTSSGYAGGLVGTSTVPFTNGKSFCKIDALGFTGAGLICGSTRETATATNCHCGGIITESGANADGDPVSKEVVVTADNYYKYIYGAESDAETAVADKCGFISAIDATPVDSTGAPIVTE